MLRWLRRDPGIASLLGAYAATLLAFLFFGRYFQGNYLGYIVAVAAPVPFLRPDLVTIATRRLRGLLPRGADAARRHGVAVLAPVAVASEPGESPAE